MTIDSITSSINRDGKAVVGTLGAIFGAIEKIALAATGLYLLSKKFPSVTTAITVAISGIYKEVAKSFPLVEKAVKSVSGQFAKLAKTDIGKRVGLALAAPVITKALLSIAAVAVVTAGAFTKLFLNRTRNAADIKDLSDALDLTTQAIQGLRSAAEATRTPFDSVVSAIQHIEKAQSEAVSGSEEMQKNFDKLSKIIGDFRNKSPHEVFMLLSKAVQDGKISVGNFSAMLAVMGKESKSLIPAMKDGLAGLSEEFGKAGANRTVLDLLDEADTKIQKAWVSAKGLAGALGTSIAAGSILLVKRYANFASLVTDAQAGQLGFKGAWDKYGDRRANAELVGDKNYDESLNKSTELEAKLRQQQTMREAEEKEADELKKKNDERQRELDLSQMTVDQRREALTLEKQSLETQMASTKNKVDEQKLREKLIDVNKRLLSDREEYKGQQGMARSSDDLAKIGLMRGTASSANRTIQVQNQQLSIQRNLLNVQRDQLRALSNILRESQTANRLNSDV